MRRFFQSSPPNADKTLTLEGPEANHAARVIRLSPGDRAIVLDGAGNEYVCEAAAVDRKRVVFSIKDIRTETRPRTQIRLFQSVIKGRAFDFVLQKAVELGATEIIPVMSDRAVAKINAREIADKVEKWRQVAVEAIKQCGAVWLPDIQGPTSIEDGLQRDAATELRIVASLQENGVHIRTEFDSFQHHERRLPGSVSVWIGPEGDFSEEEYRLLKAAGVVGVSFGDRVLRSETAAVYALAVLGYEISAPR